MSGDEEANRLRTAAVNEGKTVKEVNDAAMSVEQTATRRRTGIRRRGSGGRGSSRSFGAKSKVQKDAKKEEALISCSKRRRDTAHVEIPQGDDC